MENNNQSDSSLREYILGLKLKSKSEPGVEYLYSNLAYDILGYIIEKVSGLSFDDYLKANLLDQSEMHNSDFRYFKIRDSLKSSPHTKGRMADDIYVRKTYPYTREHAPSSTLNSSAVDLSRWMIHFLARLNSENTLAEMIQPSTDVNPQIGLGFQLYEIDGKKGVGHFGGDRGFRSFLLIFPAQKIGLVLLANCDYNEDFRQEIIVPIAKLMLAKVKPY